MGDGFTVVLRVALFVVVIVIVVDFVVDVVAAAAVVVEVVGRRPKTTPRAIPVNTIMITNDTITKFFTEKYFSLGFEF